jgi:hypothetical protein
MGNIPLARWHSALVDGAIKEKHKKAILHGMWAAAYIGISFIPMFFNWNTAKWSNILLGFSFAGLHASVFPVAYNRYRNLPDFNLSITSTALFDRGQVALGFKNSKAVNISSFIISVGLVIWYLL